MMTVASLAGVLTIQDAGRPGRMHEGVPPGGPLVPELLARANIAAGNDPGAAALELTGSVSITTTASALLATDDGRRHEVTATSPFSIASARAVVRYVAVRGGIDVPVVLGGRGTLVVAGLGGLDGRPLRRGDVIAVGTAAFSERALPDPPDLDAPIRVILGPDGHRFDDSAKAILLSSTFQVDARVDRVGMGLSGPPLLRSRDQHDHDVGPSCPLVRGAIQVPGSGALIVLGPDHPTTGGYPVIATVVRGSLGALAARAMGASVRFVVTETSWALSPATPSA